MDDRRFDDLARMLAAATSRRRVMRGLVTSIAGAGLVLGSVEIAQGVTCGDKTCPDGVRCVNDKCRCTVCDDDDQCQFTSVQAAIDAAQSGDTITICEGTYTEDITLSRKVTLIGAGSGKTKLKGADGSVVTVAKDIVAAIRALTITGGTGTLHDDFLMGGGVFNEGTLTLIDAVVGKNQAEKGGGIVNLDVSTLTLDNTKVAVNTAVIDNPRINSVGGGILNLFGGELTIKNGSDIVGNQAGQSGGIHNNGILRVRHSTIRDNKARVNGGGMINDSGGQLTLDDALIQNNSADRNGGGLFITFGHVTLKNGSVIARNKAGEHGGGLFNRSSGRVLVSESVIRDNTATENGGGVFNIGKSLKFVNARVNRNESDQSGGGIYNSGEAGPSGGTLFLEGTLVRRNDAKDDGGGIFNADGGRVTLDAQSAVTRNDPDNCVGTNAC